MSIVTDYSILKEQIIIYKVINNGFWYQHHTVIFTFLDFTRIMCKRIDCVIYALFIKTNEPIVKYNLSRT